MQNFSENVVATAYIIGKSIDYVSNHPEASKLPPTKFFSATELSLTGEMVSQHEAKNGIISEQYYAKKVIENADRNNIYFARSFAAKEFISSSIRNNGVQQAVDIGCGFNFGIVELALSNPDIKFFAVDKKEIIDAYKEVLDKKIPGGVKNLTLVTCDLEKDNLSSAMKNAGHDINKKTVSSSQGVVSHLSAEGVDNVFTFAGEGVAPNSTFTFSVVQNGQSPHKTIIKKSDVKEVAKEWGIDIYSDKNYKETALDACKQVGVDHVNIKDPIGGVVFRAKCMGKEVSVQKPAPNDVSLFSVIASVKQNKIGPYRGGNV